MTPRETAKSLPHQSTVGTHSSPASRGAAPSDRSEPASRGRAARAQVPRGIHGDWKPDPDRPDPVSLLEEQAASRVQELVPLRYGRMLVSPFTFYRGAAYLMASDLAATPHTGLTVQLCGDAHLSNFGTFAAPDRRLVFGLNDFDETLPGPFEWDVKRLVASFAVAGRDRGFDTKRARGRSTWPWSGPTATAMRDLPGANARRLVRPPGRGRVQELIGDQVEEPGASGSSKNVAKARAKDSMKALRQAGRGRRRPAEAGERSAAGRARCEELFAGRGAPASSRRRCATVLSPTGAACKATTGTCWRASSFVRSRPQGRRRGQRRHPGVDRVAAGQRRRRPAVPAGQGGPGVGAGALPGAGASTPTTGSGWSRVSG